MSDFQMSRSRRGESSTAKIRPSAAAEGQQGRIGCGAVEKGPEGWMADWRRKTERQRPSTNRSGYGYPGRSYSPTGTCLHPSGSSR
jgi:hypothetical protein